MWDVYEGESLGSTPEEGRRRKQEWAEGGAEMGSSLGQTQRELWSSVAHQNGLHVTTLKLSVIGCRLPQEGAAWPGSSQQVG